MGLLGRGNVVTTQSGSHSRTITGYLAHLLEHPRWLMECDIDFTQCPYHGHYENFVAECETCIYGEGCKWLSSYTIGAMKEASPTDLVDALESAVDYVAGRQQDEHQANCACDNCKWLRKSRQFLRSFPE